MIDSGGGRCRFTIREMLESGIDRFVLREAINRTCAANEFPKRKGKGRPPEYERYCATSRSYKGKRLEADNSGPSGRFSGRLICYQDMAQSRPQNNQGGYSQPSPTRFTSSGSYLLVLATVMTLQLKPFITTWNAWPAEHFSQA
ncbi:hypothetical protein KFU94_61545 [Chloroflexi bacterium TSY]|nr:hypothetical protein [Chloroflexi bacterium TSY]